MNVPRKRHNYVEISTHLLNSYELFKLTPSEFRVLITVATNLALWTEPACSEDVLKRWGVTKLRRRKMLQLGLLKRRKDGRYEVGIDLVRHRPLKDNVRIARTPGGGYTYVIQSGDSGPVKIGQTMADPQQRLSTLQTAHFDRLYLRALYDGAHRERELHELFQRYRMNGEWFKPEVLELLKDAA
jgi:hypothetical protein